MSGSNLLIRNFKRTPKFLKLNNNLSCEHSISAKKNLKLSEKHLNAINQKLMRNFKQEKKQTLFMMNKNLTKKSLGSKLGCGKGKFSMRVSMIRKHQILFFFNSKNKVVAIKKTLSKFSKAI